jgi:preprotein translocase subunit SecA
MVTRAIANAQKKVEAHNFEIRKQLLEYDDVMNKQRESVYTLRREILEGQVRLSEEEVVDTRTYLFALAEDLLEEQIERYAGKDRDDEEWDIPALIREVSRVFGIDPRELEQLDLGSKNPDEMADEVWALIKGSYESKEQIVGGDIMRRVERDIMLQIVDAQWKDHLYSLDHLKEGIGLRGYGQRDPLVEYKKESYTLFQDMKARVEEEMLRYLFWLRPVLSDDAGGEAPPPMPVPRTPPRRPSPMPTNNPSAAGIPAFAGARSTNSVPEEETPRPARTGGDDVIKTVRREEPKVGRNDPCPCGSGRKYKKCHGAAA